MYIKQAADVKWEGIDYLINPIAGLSLIWSELSNGFPTWEYGPLYEVTMTSTRTPQTLKGFSFPSSHILDPNVELIHSSRLPRLEHTNDPLDKVTLGAKLRVLYRDTKLTY